LGRGRKVQGRGTEKEKRTNSKLHKKEVAEFLLQRRSNRKKAAARKKEKKKHFPRLSGSRGGGRGGDQQEKNVRGGSEREWGKKGREHQFDPRERDASCRKEMGHVQEKGNGSRSPRRGEEQKGDLPIAAI